LSTVFNIQDVFTPLPEGTNRFVHIWGLLIFNLGINLKGLQEYITPLGTWTIFNGNYQTWLNQAIAYMQSHPRYRAIKFYDPEDSLLSLLNDTYSIL
jgi:hypothetical protein